MSSEAIVDQIFALSPQVRYVAIYRHGKLFSRMREGAAQASQVESDGYEELLVNPALLTPRKTARQH